MGAVNTIYLLHNTVNDKKYVGQTWTSLKRRWQSGYDNSIHLHRAMKKYGRDAFYYEVLALCSDQTTADYLESYYIELYDTCNDDNGYNLRPGGENKFQHSPATIVKMSDAKQSKAKLKLEWIGLIRKAFSEGTTLEALALRYNVHVSTIGNVVYLRTWKRVPGDRPPKNRQTSCKNYKLTPYMREQIFLLRDEGLSYKQISEKLPGIGASTVRDVIKGYTWKSK